MTFFVHSRAVVDQIADLFLDRGLTDGQIGIKLNLTRCQVSGLRHRNGIFRDLDQPLLRAKVALSLTHERLCWAHGENRAADIIAGRDPASNADEAAWERLGRRAGVAA